MTVHQPGRLDAAAPSIARPGEVRPVPESCERESTSAPALFREPWRLAVDPSGLPRISLVTPNYNYAHFLEATLRSVLDQGYPNLEYVVIDGGSRDESLRVIEPYAPRLAYWHSRPDKGMYDAITTGLQRTTGEIMGWLNSDDMHLPWTLWTVADIFARFPAVQWITTLTLGEWDYTGLCLGFGANRGYSRAAYLDGRYGSMSMHDPRGVPPWARESIQQESTFWRRSLWEKAGGYVSTEYGSAGDFELWGRFFEHAELVGVTAPLSGFRLQHAQQSADSAKYAGHAAHALETHRRKAAWRPPATRFLSYHTRFWKLPKIRTIATGWAGYSGQRIRRTETSLPTAQWALESYRFY